MLLISQLGDEHGLNLNQITVIKSQIPSKLKSIFIIEEFTQQFKD